MALSLSYFPSVRALARCQSSSCLAPNIYWSLTSPGCSRHQWLIYGKKNVTILAI